MLHEYVATGPRCAAERRLAGRSVRLVVGAALWIATWLAISIVLDRIG